MGDWLAYPFGDAQIAKLKQHFGIQGIPTLIALDADGKVLDKAARGTVTNKKAAALKGGKWCN